MRVLLNKLRRTIWNTRGQFLAVTAVVALGITVFISMTTSYYNLNRSKDQFYRENNFADYYFHVVKAPEQVTRQIESLPGVAAVTGRIQKDVPLFKEDNQRATARVTGYTSPVEGVNRIKLTSGRLFEDYPQGGGVEVLTDSQFFRANGLSFNKTVDIVADGRKVPLTVVGTATGPEFTFAMKDAATLMPDPVSFGLFMMPLSQVQQVLNLPGQINQVIVKFSPGADEEKVAEQIEAILEPYGNLSSYPRKNQLSHTVLQGELDGLKASSRFLPTIFLGIAAAIQMVMLSRMIRSQRLQIGIMKALGYSSRQVMAHYTGYSLASSLAGALLGTLMGVGLASVLLKAYADIFNLPLIDGGLNLEAVIYGFLLSLAVGAAAGVTASRGVVSINPAESMRPEPPKKSGRVFIEHLPFIWSNIDSTWKMSIRAAARNRGRFVLMLVGVTFAVALLVMSLCFNDSIDYLIKKQFYHHQQYNYFVRFTSPVKESELLNITRIEGVVAADPVLEVPVKVHFKGKSRDDSLQGLPPDTDLMRLEDQNGRPLIIPEEGVLLSHRTADKLGIAAGDLVEVETMMGTGPSRRAELVVAGINKQMTAGGSFVSLKQANIVLQESQIVSGVMMKVDPGMAEALEEKLSDMTGVSSISSRQKELDNFNKNMEAMVYSMAIMITFAVVLGFAIVYNSSVISFAERKRELASLRVLGFSNSEVSGLLLKESMLQSLLGVAAGLPFGRIMSQAYVNAVSTDLFTMQVVVYPMTYFLSALGGVFFIVVAHLLSSRGVKKLDLVDVLKNRD